MTQVFAVTTKNPDAVLDYQIDWSDYLEDGETISTSSWTVPSGITKESDDVVDSNTDARIVLSGGTLGEVYDLVNTITTDTTISGQARKETRTLRVAIGYKSDVDRVRWLVGDQDSSDELSADDEYVFALSEAEDNKYAAAALVARSIAGKFARHVDTSFEGIRSQYSQRQKHYLSLAVRMEREAKKRGGLGTPAAGGISIGEMDDVEDDSDRPDPAFKRRQFRHAADRQDAEDWWQYHR